MNEAASGPMIQMVCVKWGERYGPEDVNRLCRAARRHSMAAFRFVCITDRPDGGYDDDIVIKPFPDFSVSHDVLKHGCRLKLSIFAPGMLADGLPTIFFDLDTMICGDISRLVAALHKNPGLFMLQNHFIPLWRVQKTLRPLLAEAYYFGNSSILAFMPEDFHFVFEAFNRRILPSGGQRLPKYLATDERFMSYIARDRTRVFSHRLAVKFAEEFMLPLPALEEFRKALPWVAARRRNLVAVTFVGSSLKPNRLVTYEKGQLVRHKRLKIYWNHDAYRDYWLDRAAPHPV